MSLTPEDRIAIQDVITRYAFSYSNADIEGFGAIFADDASFELYWSGALGSRLDGKKAITDWAADVFRLMPITRHARMWLSLPLVDGDRERATASTFFNNLSCHGDSLATGVLKMTFRRAKSGWLVASLQALIDGSREESAAREALALARAKRG